MTAVISGIGSAYLIAASKRQKPGQIGIAQPLVSEVIIHLAGLGQTLLCLHVVTLQAGVAGQIVVQDR
jgi:hypothetical protein